MSRRHADPRHQRLWSIQLVRRVAHRAAGETHYAPAPWTMTSTIRARKPSGRGSGVAAHGSLLPLGAQAQTAAVEVQLCAAGRTATLRTSLHAASSSRTKGIEPMRI
jgi:hypothetical protein